MQESLIVQVSAYPGWLIGVSRHERYSGYFCCWIVDPNCNVLSDGRNYETSNAAMKAGRAFVERHMEP